jgi:hypothetical protein
MRFVVIHFSVLDDSKPEDEQEGLEQSLVIPLQQLAQCKAAVLPGIVSDQAQRYWEALVMMGETGL